MIKLLAKKFIPDWDNYTDPSVRGAYGTLCGLTGIVLNILLFAGKYFAGAVSGSIAIVADAFNNLSDALSSFVTLLGFRLAGKKPDAGHPFGHGRVEYISGLAVSALIILMGFELGRDSITKIFHPEAVSTGWLQFAILAVAIAVKAYMCVYNRAVGKKISSAAMMATATDSLSDCGATAAVLVASLISRYANVNIDGYAGAVVAVFIILAGIGAARDTISPLLGQAPDPEFIREINSYVTSFPEVSSIHDLVVHDYGPGRLMISLHAEVDGKGDIFELHDAIDNIERGLQERFGCHAVIHMDPIEADSDAVHAIRLKLSQLVKTIDESISIHDLRIVAGPSHTNVIFDAVVPQGFYLSDEETAQRIKTLVAENFENHYAIVTIDKSYV